MGQRRKPQDDNGAQPLALRAASNIRSALKQSAVFHTVLLSAAVTVSWLAGSFNVHRQQIKIDIVDAPTVNKTPPEKPVVQMKAPPKVIPKAKAVFGLSRDAHSDETGAVEVKVGNTLAKDIDNEKLDANDPTHLPVPAEEYLVTAMPRLKHEVRVPYPPEAKIKNVEGAVVMDVLIDDQGKVRKADLVSGPGYGLNEAALQAIYSFEFAPALIDNKPVAVRIRYAYRFVLN